MATLAVSRSRISPTMMMSGSWRRIERSTVAKSSPICGRTCVWLIDAVEVIFDRVLDGEELAVAAIELAQGGIECRRLAAAGRPRHQHDAVRLVDHLANAADRILRKAEA